MRDWCAATALLACACALGACDEINDELKGTPVPPAFEPNYDPAEAVIPFPNNLLFLGTDDGTLNIPVADPTNIADPQVALNALDGFSTIAPMSTGFTLPIDNDTATLAGGVRVFTVTLDDFFGTATGLPLSVMAVTGELAYGTQFAASVSSTDPDGATLAIVPLVPLLPRTSYLVVLTNNLKSTDGQSASANTVYNVTRFTTSLLNTDGTSKFGAFTDEQARALEPLRLLVNAQDAAMNAFDDPTCDPTATSCFADTAVLAWTFTTQSIGVVLNTARGLIPAAPVSALVDSGLDSPLGAASLYVGTLEVPYLLSAASGPSDPTPLGTWWQAANEFPPGSSQTNLTGVNPLPVVTSTQTIPLLVSIPNAGAGPPWPVVIFQHGLTRNRGVMLGIADSMAAAGFAVVATDLPLHGVTGNETDGTAPLRMAGLERTFDLDLVTQDPVTEAIIAQVPDGVIDTSGRHAINPASLLTSRDNLRQAVLDLFTLLAALGTMNAGGNGFDTNNVHMVAFSTGGFGGAVALSLDAPPSIGASVLAMTAGGLAKTLDASANFGPQFAAGLEAAAGLVKGSADYERFMGAFQTLVDSGDPLNYTAGTVTGRSVMMIEVVGDGGSNVPDQVLINNVFPVPLAGTQESTVPSPTAGSDLLARLLGLNVIDPTLTANPETAPWLRFTAGHHGSLLTPDDAAGNPDAISATVTGIMQQAAVSYLAADGTGFALPAGADMFLESP